MPTCEIGLIGAGIASSLSPPLHETEARQHGLTLTYTLLDTDETDEPLDLLLGRAQDDGWSGLNVTHPHKQEVLAELDELSSAAAAIGAVNTVVFTDGRRVGHNTDASGFSRGFARELPDVARDSVVQLGAGGAGAAVAHAQLSNGVGRLTLVDPDDAQRQRLTSSLRERFGDDRVAERSADDLSELLEGADGVVNASPTGMREQPGSPVPPDLLRADLWVAELVYMPRETALLREARAVGAPVCSGLAMCVFQAAGAFELFTGREPDTDRMFQHLEVLLADEPETPAPGGSDD